MPMQCDRAGNFRGPIIGSALNKAPGTKSKFIELRCKVEDFWNGSEWDDWRQYDMEAYGGVCIVKKDGTINEIQATPMLNYAGWDGDFAHLGDDYPLGSVRFTTKENNFTRQDGTAGKNFKIEWIDDYNSTPGGGLKSNIDEGDVRSLNAEHGAALRALKANAQRNAPKPTGRPATPPAAAPSQTSFNAPDAVETAKRESQGIPF